jgi:hypothetical protein
MSRLVLPAALAFLIGLNASALAQMTVTPGPGGTPIAPGSAVPGFTPGGVGPGGTDVGPGPAARGVPMYRIGPGDIPLAPRPDPYPANPNETVRLHGGCGNGNCVPESLPQSDRLIIDSQDAGTGKPPTPDTPISSMKDLTTALRACWHPPALEQAQGRSQMTVRVSFKRTGEIIGQPFVTYTMRGMSADTRKTYLGSIRGAFERCSPLPFSKKFSAAVAGRPITIRYLDDRAPKAGSRQR